MESALTIKERMLGAIWGQFAGDAAALGTHWIYNLSEMKKNFPDGVKGFETPRPGHYHEGKKSGDFTHYGEAALLMLESVSALGHFDEKDYGKKFIEKFGSKSYTGYLDNSTRLTISNYNHFIHHHPVREFDYLQGVDDNQMATASRLAPVVVAHLDDPGLLKVVERATRFSQNNETAVNFMRSHARILHDLLKGAELESVFQTEISRSTEKIQSFLKDALSLLPQTVTEATLKLGQSCPLDCSFPSSFHSALKHKNSFPDAILATISAGGDNAGRASMVGAWLGAYLGVQAIPKEWTARINAKDRIDQYTETLLKKIHL